MTKKLIVTGCHRSGTTLLAAMVGAHRDVALINEGRYKEFNYILSKKYVGVKMPIPKILLHKKRSRLFVRLYWLLKWLYRRKHVLSACDFTIDDFDKIIFIYRDMGKNVESIMRETHVTRENAERDVKIADSIAKELNYRDVCFINLKILTRFPIDVMSKVCKYLDLPFDQSMLEGYRYTPKYNYKRILNKE